MAGHTPAYYDGDKEEYGVQSHRAGEGYSNKNKIPTVRQFLDKQKALTSQGETVEEHDKHWYKKSDKDSKDDKPKTEKEIEMEKSKHAGETPNAKSFKREGEREVMDPVTGRKVMIKDAKLEDFQNPKLFSEKALDPSKPNTGGPAVNVPGHEGGDHTKEQAPIEKITPAPVEPSNICLQQFPPPVTDSVKPIAGMLNQYVYFICAGLGLVWVLVAFGAGWKAFVFRSSVIGTLAAAVFVSFGIVSRKIEKEFERIRLEQHKQRGEKFSPPTPESVEWLNAFTKVVWPLINPSMFVSIVDMIEDVMQASLPGFIDAVKVEDFTIGKNALRIVSMRALPDQPHEDEYPREEWIDQGDEKEALDPKRKKLSPEDEKRKQEIEAKANGTQVGQEDEDQTGDYVNMEISFAYFAPPGKKNLHNENISLIIKFFLGAYDLFHLPIPIWIAVESIVGTVRLRCQLVPQVPFIRNATFTLMGVPAIEASAIPMSRALPNVLDLPLVSGFVQSSIAAATAVYCAPKSMTMNIAQMISGDGIKKETKAMGILKVTIKYAENLSAQDSNGHSDPYVVLAFAKFGKPLFSTRIIERDCNPVWEQTAFLLVDDDAVRAQEKLSIQLWDSDKLSVDDLVGRIQVPLIDLMLSSNKVHTRTDKLMGYEDAKEMDGTLTWQVAYYDKVKLNPALKKEPGVDHDLPAELQNRPELKNEATTADQGDELDVRRTPPDPKYRSGILSVIIHQINNLERQELKGQMGKNQEGQSGQDDGDKEDNTPSAYCEIVLNDDLVYKTRVKQYSSMPFFEAGSEFFVRDYQEAVVRVVVRDSRLREHDPILGIVNLPLDKILAHASEVTKLYAIQDGVGFGKVNISVLFKGVEMELPRNMAGWDTGTVEIKAPIKVTPVPGVDFDFKAKKLNLSTLEANEKLSARHAEVAADGSITWQVKEEVRLPTYDRYSSALFFEYGGGLTVGPLGTKVEAFAALWLSELEDDEDKQIRIPVVVSEKIPLNSLRENVLSEQCEKTHEYTIVGWLETTVGLDAGLDEDHLKYATTQTARHEFETYDRVEGQAAMAEENSHAADDGVVDKEEQKAIAAQRKKALEYRHRGKLQFAPVRTSIWAKDGLKSRARRVKMKLTGQTERNDPVQSESAA